MPPNQRPLNSLLYALPQTTIPLDGVYDEMVAEPRRWGLDVVRKFMLVFGPLGSLFDVITFGFLLSVFQTEEELFQAGCLIG
jgi:P-type Mg2+ transporter